MTMHAAFLADVAANIDDDAPRLVFADWLDDHSDPDRARFIRAQCRLAKMGPCDPDRFALDADAEDLLAKYGKKWLRPLAKISTRVEFARGFPHRIGMPVAKFVAQGEAALAAAPTLREYRPLQHAAAWLELLSSPVLGRLTTLDVGFAKVGVARIAALAAASLVAGLRSLNVSGSAMRSKGAAALAASPHLASLRRLALRRNEMGDVGIGQIAASTNLPALESLDVSNNRLSADGVAALARSSLAGRLKELAVGENGGGDAQATAFAAGEWASLRNLSLSLGQMTAAGISALAGCPSLAGLRELELSWEGSQDCTALFNSPHLRRLERLALLSPVGHGSLEGLAGSPMLAGLRGLAVTGCDGGMNAVLASRAASGLVELRYTGNAGGLDAVAQGFALAEHLTGLRKVRIGPWRHTGSSRWVREILGSPHLGGVVDLELSGPLDGPTIEALIASPHLSGLRRLRLDGWQFWNRREWRQKLEERFGDDVLSL